MQYSDPKRRIVERLMGLQTNVNQRRSDAMAAMQPQFHPPEFLQQNPAYQALQRRNAAMNAPQPQTMLGPMFENNRAVQAWRSRKPGGR